MINWFRRIPMGCLVVAVAGCAGTEDVQYLINEADDVSFYVDKASEIEYPHVEHSTDRDSFARAPHTIASLARDRIRDLSLEQCVELALQNARIIRSGTSVQAAGNVILSSPNNAPSVFDPAIQETGVLFGGRGVNAALAAFDAQFSTRAVWGRSDSIRNSPVPGFFGENSDRSTALAAELGKTFGYGGQFTLGQEVNYSKNRNPGTFASSYSGNVSAEYRHPLLAGAGTEFTQIAGPISNQFGGLSGVNQGVVIARINHDISLTDFEESLINLLKDVEDAYWNLHLQYRIYDTQVKARQSAQKSWSDSRAKLDLDGAPGFQVEHEPQARDRYFETKALAEQALSELYKNEISLRRLIGLPVNDGEVLRPSDEPLTAMFRPDWTVSVAEGLTHRVEIRRHKWNIKSLELQLIAAESLVRPRLDLIASYQLVGFGDRLLDHGRGLFNSYAGTINDNRHTGWTAGAVFELPIGLRSARAQVQNLELRLAKAREVLVAQEHDVSHQLAFAFQDLAEQYRTAQTNFNRRAAAAERTRILGIKVKNGSETLDEYLRAQASYANAEIAYYRSLISYNQAITNLQFRQGTLLPHNSITLAEGQWEPAAYVEALRLARARSNAFDADAMLHTEPLEFVETDPHWNDGYSHDRLLTVDPIDMDPEDSSVPEPELEEAPAVPVPGAPPADEPPARLQPDTGQPDSAALRPVVPLPAPDISAARPAGHVQDVPGNSVSRQPGRASGSSRLPRDEGLFLPPVRAGATRIRSR